MSVNDARRDADGSCVIGHVRDHNCVGADARVRADHDRPDDLCARADEHLVAETRAAAALGTDRDLNNL